jgi:hypothetical protein
MAYKRGPTKQGIAKSREEKKGLPYADDSSFKGYMYDKGPKMTLEEKIIKKIRERAPKKMGGGIMKKPMGYNKGVMIEKQRPGRSIPVPEKPSKGQDLRDKIKKTLPKTKEGMPVGGKMKKPKPGSYDYQLESTMKPSYKGMRVGGMSRGMGAAIAGGKFEGVK